MKFQLIVWAAAAAALLWNPCDAGDDYKLKMKRCRQSSTYLDAKCERALDGNTNQNFSHGSCSQVDSESYGWWSATFERPVTVSRIQIYNRQDCCAERPYQLKIFVGSTECTEYIGKPFSVKTFHCLINGLTVALSSRNASLTLCEVNVFGKEIYEDIKLSRCNQSSTYETNSCEKAIEGNSDKNASHRSCAQVMPGTNGWWQAETAKLAMINRVLINGSGLVIFSLNATVDGHNCYSVRPVNFNRLMFSCDLKGTLVRISIDRLNLSLCEVYALGQYLDELPLSTCQQSSTFGNNTCEKAMDGNAKQNFSHGSCSQVGDESTGWWQAETERPALIHYVQIYNRQDCCSERLTNFSISIDGSLCDTYDGRSFGEKVFKCALKGTLLKISSSKAKLTLCEVKVFGKYLENKIGFVNCYDTTSSFHRYGSICSRAMDGNMGTCTQSQINWLLAESEGDVLFEFVHIISNPNCCPERLIHLNISVNNIVCNDYNGTRFSNKYFRCFKNGSRLVISSNKPLAICEVTAYGEYFDRQFKLRNCTMSEYPYSSLSPIAILGCSVLIDGLLPPPGFTPASIAVVDLRHTKRTHWWKAYTERQVFIKWVNIYGIGNCCPELNRNAITCCRRSLYRDKHPVVIIYVDGGICSRKRVYFPNHLHIPCLAYGSELLIQDLILGPTHGSILMTEVTAFGQYMPADTYQLKLLRCSQSSTNADRTCDRAIDGKTDMFTNCSSKYVDYCLLYCSLLQKEPTGWWKAETERPALFKFVQLYNRHSIDLERLVDFKISVDGKECYTHDKSDEFFLKRIRCYEQGTVLKIDSNQAYMILCEVKAFGKYID